MSSSATLARPTSTAPVPAMERPERPVPPALPSRGLRLTRRGRLTLTLFIAVLALVVTIVGAASVSAAGSAPSAPATATVVVQPGQTLWEVAEQVAPKSDPRDVIARITELNALTSPLVAPGQSLVVPAS